MEDKKVKHYYSYCIKWSKLDGKGRLKSLTCYGSYYDFSTSLKTTMDNCLETIYREQARYQGYTLEQGALISFNYHPQFTEVID